MKNSFVSALLLTAAVLCVGVSGCGKAAPSDFPQLVPFKVKVVDGGKGIADVQVVLANNDPKAPGAVAGTTDASGVAVINTTYKNYTANGAPTGEYRVTCIKDPVVDHWKTDAELGAMSMGERAEYYAEWQEKCDALPREVPKSLGQYDNSPLTTSVSADGEYVVDVAEYAE